MESSHGTPDPPPLITRPLQDGSEGTQNVPVTALNLPLARVFANPRFRELAAAVLLAGATVRLGLSLVEAFANMSDFRIVFIPNAVLAWHGVNPYRDIPLGAQGTFSGPLAGSVYTPTFLMLMWPWTWLPDAAGRITWILGELASLAGILVLVARGLGGMTRAQLMLGMALMMVFPPVRDSFNEGQVSLLLGFLVVAALFAAERGNPRLAGLCLGLAVAIKITPVLLVPYFLWRRRWGAAIYAGVVLALTIAATFALGWGAYWGPFVRAVGEVGQGTANLLNQSLNGVILRAYDPRLNGYPIAPPPPLPRALVAVASLLLLTALLAHLRRRRLPTREQPWADIALLLLALPLIQPFAWPHHFAQAAVFCPVAVALVARRRLPASAAVVLAAAYLALLLFSFPLYRQAVSLPPAELAGNPGPLLGGSLLFFAVVAGAATWGLLRLTDPGEPAAATRQS